MKFIINLYIGKVYIDDENKYSFIDGVCVNVNNRNLRIIEGLVFIKLCLSFIGYIEYVEIGVYLYRWCYRGR